MYEGSQIKTATLFQRLVRVQYIKLIQKIFFETNIQIRCKSSSLFVTFGPASGHGLPSGIGIHGDNLQRYHIFGRLNQLHNLKMSKWGVFSNI